MRRILLLMATVVVAGACGAGDTHGTLGPETTTTAEASQGLGALAAARAQWDASAPTNYVVTQWDRCDGCPTEPQTVAVREGEVVSLASTETETIEDVFATIEDAIRGGADVEVVYDEALGYPTRLVIDLDGAGSPDVDLELGELEAMPIVETLEELLAAKQLWEAHNLTSYRYIFRADCTCPDGGTFEVEVRDGDVKAVRPLDAAAETSDLHPTELDAAFTDLETWLVDSGPLIADGLLAVDVRMDPKYGYPRWFRIEGADIDSERFAGKFTLIVTLDLVTTLPAPPSLDLREVTDARARWQRAAVTDYQYVVTVHCECSEDERGPFLITVREGEVVSAARTTDGRNAPDHAVTIDGVFDVIELSIAENVDVDVTYDPILGYPVLVILDPEAVAVDGGVAFTISDFDTGT